jgi:hypothetical protein
MKKAEATMTADLRRALEGIGAWVYKIPDAAILPKESGFRRTPVARPFDLVVCYRGRLLAIEVKQMCGYKAFSPRMMQPSQVEHLTTVEAAGGDAFVALFVHESRKFRHLHWFCWPGLQQRWALRGSIRKAELMALPDYADWTKPKQRVINRADFDRALVEYRAGKSKR